MGGNPSSRRVRRAAPALLGGTPFMLRQYAYLLAIESTNLPSECTVYAHEYHRDAARRVFPVHSPYTLQSHTDILPSTMGHASCYLLVRSCYKPCRMDAVQRS